MSWYRLFDLTPPLPAPMHLSRDTVITRCFNLDTVYLILGFSRLAL
jgi:hypothetical protein